MKKQLENWVSLGKRSREVKMCCQSQSCIGELSSVSPKVCATSQSLGAWCEGSGTVMILLPSVIIKLTSESEKGRI